MHETTAREVLEASVIYYRGRPVGTAAATPSRMEAENYGECFIRDFVPSALWFLMRGETEIVRNFLTTVLELRTQQPVMIGHARAPGLMPASFRVEQDGDEERLVADFGDQAIGRVAPVDSALWWMFLLRAYVHLTGDRALVEDPGFQESIVLTLDLYLKEGFEAAPTMLVPDGAFMIDRRMGVYGHPLEIQALFYGMLSTACELLSCSDRYADLIAMMEKRGASLRSYVRLFYWMDRERLNQIHRFRPEQFGAEAENMLNIHPESIPDWMDGWLDHHGGYLVGNVGPSRIDFRFFALGNLLAILFGLVAEEDAQRILHLYEHRWECLVGEMPMKICYPAVAGDEWRFLTGSDPKNAPWSYHNGGNWPVLLWPFVGAALRTGREDLARSALDLAEQRLAADEWPEYYDGRTGSLIGRRANFRQTWSATAYLVSRLLLDDPDCRDRFEGMMF